MRVSAGRNGALLFGHEPGQGVPPELRVLEGRDPVAEHRRSLARLGRHPLEDAQDLLLEALRPVIGEVGLPGLVHSRSGPQRPGDPVDVIAESLRLAPAERCQALFRDPVGMDLVGRQTVPADTDLDEEARFPVIEVGELIEGEVPQAVGDEPAPAHLQSLGNVGMVADDAVGSGGGQGPVGRDDVGRRKGDVFEAGVGDDDDEIAALLGFPDEGRDLFDLPAADAGPSAGGRQVLPFPEVEDRDPCALHCHGQRRQCPLRRG